MNNRSGTIGAIAAVGGILSMVIVLWITNEGLANTSWNTLDLVSRNGVSIQRNYATAFAAVALVGVFLLWKNSRRS